MLILENLLGLKSKQADVTAAFIHATLGEDKKVYVEMHLGFKQHRKFKVLLLKKALYCLNQSPHTFWKYFIEKLVTLVYLKLLSIPASLLVKRSLQSATLMI